MTLALAWKIGNTIHLAADRRVVTPDHGIQEDAKIFEAHGLTFAFAGEVQVEHWLRLATNIHAYDPSEGSVPDWWCRSLRISLKGLYSDMEYQMIVTDGKDVYVTMDGCFLRRTTSPITAIGEAAPYAYGYMDTVPYVTEHALDTAPKTLLALLFETTSRRYDSVSSKFDYVVFKKRRAKK